MLGLLPVSPMTRVFFDAVIELTFAVGVVGVGVAAAHACRKTSRPMDRRVTQVRCSIEHSILDDGDGVLLNAHIVEY